MISKNTAMQIFNAHREIEKANTLISDIQKELAKNENNTDLSLENAFGERRSLTLGVPSGTSGQTLMGVSVVMAVKVMEEHIKNAEKRLEELMAIAKIELM